MIIQWVAYVYIGLAFLASAEGLCGDAKMTKQMISVTNFRLKVRSIFKTAPGKLECAEACNEDERCNGILVCPDVCYLFGVFILNLDYSLNYETCEVFQINRCQKDGFPDDNGYCVCPRGYGGPLCENRVHDICYYQWQEVYNSGTSQSNDGLRQIADNPKTMKLKYLIGDKIYTVNRFGILGNTIWSQTVHELSKLSWNTFDVNPKRIFSDIFDGINQAILIFDMNGTLISSPTAAVNATWFSKEIANRSKCIDGANSLSSGDVALLISKFKSGSFATDATSLFIKVDKQTFTVENIDKLGQKQTTPVFTYTMPPYWGLTRYSSTADLSVLRWSVGQATLRPSSSFPYHQVWCTDDCWLKLFSSNESGQEIYGSASTLARAVLGGHQLRVFVGGLAANVRSVFIVNRFIGAFLQEMMEPIDVKKFNLFGTAQRKIVSSDGTVQTRRYTFETDSVLQDLKEQLAVDWFVDTREWIQALVVTGDGLILSGSVADLREKVLKGASVRILLEYTINVQQIVDADHLHVSRDGHVAAEIINHANIQLDSYYNITFSPPTEHHLWSAIVTTRADFRYYMHTYQRNGGIHQTQSDSIAKYTWFVML